MKKKIILEYILNCSPKVLYPRLSSASGLAEWFADNVNLDGKYYAFIWDGDKQRAEVLAKKENAYVRFKWDNDDDGRAYFEFRINIDELTNEVALIITDFVYPEEETETSELWDKQVEQLKRVVGK